MVKYDPQQYRDYRKEELNPEVFALFEKARNERYKSVVPSMVDMAIHLQKTRSIETACNYVRYLLLHEMSWLDVFGEHAKRYDKQLEHYQQCIGLELKVDELQNSVSTLTDQMEQMQIMMMNMAKMLSNHKGYAAKTA